MPKVFLAEELTSQVTARFSRTIAESTASTAILSKDSRVAVAALADSRWLAGDIHCWDEAKIRLADWARRLLFAQDIEGMRSRVERGALACGLEARLRNASLGLRFYEHCVSALGVPSDQIDLELVADDPYLRDSFEKGHWRTPRPRSLRLSGSSAIAPAQLAARELAASQVGLRSQPWRQKVTPLLAAANQQRTAMVLAIAQRSIKQLHPVLQMLSERGWRVVVVHYGRALPDRQNVVANARIDLQVPFDEVSKAWVAPQRPRPEWNTDADLLLDFPISETWLRRALDAVWASVAVLLGRHRRTLEVIQPNIVFGYGTDMPSLAMQMVADEMGIPTVCMPHGFETRQPEFYAFPTTATAVYGPGCAEINKVGRHGETFTGLVPTGHPPHDPMFLEFERNRGRKQLLPALVQPASRPKLVLGLANWGFDLMTHLHQERFLTLLSEALPSNAYLVCKLHPGFEERAMCESILGATLPAEAFRVVGEREFSTQELLASCDVAVSNERSMVLSDAIVIGRPAIAVHHPESPFGVGDRNHPGKDYSQNCWIVQTSGQLKEAITALTHDQAAAALLLANRESYVNRFFVADGRAAARIADLAETLTADRAVPQENSPGGKDSVG